MNVTQPIQIPLGNKITDSFLPSCHMQTNHKPIDTVTFTGIMSNPIQRHSATSLSL